MLFGDTEHLLLSTSTLGVHTSPPSFPSALAEKLNDWHKLKRKHHYYPLNDVAVKSLVLL